MLRSVRRARLEARTAAMQAVFFDHLLLGMMEKP